MYSKLQDGSFIICGYVARDALKRATNSGKSFTLWSVAVSNHKDTDGNWKTNYTNCKAWDKAAEAAAAIRKGDTVLCIGKMETNTGNDGKTYKNLVCEYVSVMGNHAASPPSASASEGISAEDDLSEFEVLDTGDLPF